MTDIGFTAQPELSAGKTDERRTAPFRRQVNESFCSPNGTVSLSKTIAIFGQIACLYQFGKYFDELIDKPESLGLVLAFIIAPDLVKKLLTMKYGGGK